MSKHILVLPLPDLPEGGYSALVGLLIICNDRPIGMIESVAVCSGGQEIVFNITDPGFKLMNDLKFSVG